MKITEKYGKEFDNKAILRTPQWINNQSKMAQENARKFMNEAKQNITCCPMCESKNYDEFSEIYGFIYMQCNHCKNLFLSNPLQDISKLYTNDGDKSSFEIYLNDEIFTKRMECIAKPKIAFIDSLRQTREKGIWLDIGSGGGENLFVAKNLGYTIQGFESDSKAVNFSNAKLGGECVKCGFLDINNCDRELLDSIHHANIITFFNVLEHLENPKQTIEFFAKNMQKGALLAIEVPRHPSLSSYANLVSPKRVYRHLIPPYHLNIFSERALEIAYGGGGTSPLLVNGAMDRDLWI